MKIRFEFDISGYKKCKYRAKIGLVKNYLSFTRLHSGMYFRIYIFHFKNRQINKAKKKTRIKKAKETKEEKGTPPENRFKKINLRPPRWIFFLSHTFSETTVIFLVLSYSILCIIAQWIIVYIFFLSGFSFINIHDSQESKGRTRLQSVTKYLRLKLVCMWNCRFS